jgi:ell wall binding domain 2 (CWB2)
MRQGLGQAAAAVALFAALAGCGKSNTLPHAQPRASRPTSGGTTPAKSQPSAPSATANTTRVGGEDVAEDAAAIAQTVYPGLTPATRPQAVLLVGGEDWPGALAASALSAGPLKAPILFGAPGAVPAVTEAALSRMRPTGVPALHGAQVIAVGEVEVPSGFKSYPVQAKSPYALAAKLASLVDTLDGGRVAAVLVADPNRSQALAMPVAGLAAESGAPVLLVQGGAVPAATGAELEALHNPSIYAVGPAASIGEGALTGLEHFGETRRIGGGGAIQNAISVAAYTDGSFGWGVQEPGHGLVFARSDRPFDAPAAALLSATADYGPLLLLTGEEAVPAPVRRYLRDIQPGYTSEPESLPVRGVYNRGWLIGGSNAISPTVQADLDALLRSVPRSGADPAPTISP